jgi:2-oxoglutarate ferredoxin oxidoreductase subunit delta
MANINIDSDRCKGCCLCVAECPLGNIRMSEIFNKAGHHYAEIIDKDKCTGCALCCQMCPDMAIRIGPDPQRPRNIKEATQSKKTVVTGRISGESRR